MPVGIYVHGHDQGVDASGNHVHAPGQQQPDARQLRHQRPRHRRVRRRPARVRSRLAIADNNVDHLTLGASESVVVNGNVDHWTITRNHIHDNNNIGIDAIGYEQTLTGAYRYTTSNRARDGLIADNVVSRIRSEGNPAYWEDGSGGPSGATAPTASTSTAARHIRVTGNRVAVQRHRHRGRRRERQGHARTTYVLDHNLITGSLYVGIATGGYCNGADDCGGVRTGRPSTTSSTTTTLRGNNRLDDGSPELLVQYYAYAPRSSTRAGCPATNDDHAVLGTVDGAGRDGLSTPLRADHEHVLDHRRAGEEGHVRARSGRPTPASTPTGRPRGRTGTAGSRSSVGRAEAWRAGSSVERSLGLVEGPGSGWTSRELRERSCADLFEALRQAQGAFSGCTSSRFPSTAQARRA